MRNVFASFSGSSTRCGAAPKDLAKVELWGDGTALHWEELDVDFSVNGIVAGIFGTKAWMRKLAHSGKHPGSN